MIRHSYRTSLSNIIYQYENTQFSWGQLDCCIFTALVVEEFTNKKLPYWREVISYDNYRGAMKALKKLNCKKLEDLPTAILGSEKQSIDKAELGSPVYYINEDGIGILGVCNGVRSYFLQDGGGLTTRYTDDCEYCWSIN